MLISSPDLPLLRGIKVLRAGIQLGNMKGKLFFPDHALAMALSPRDGYPAFDASHDEAAAYLRGETIPCPDDLSGFLLVSHQGLTLGFGKASGGQIKNHYPKGLRRP